MRGKNITVVGAGPAGMMAAIRAAQIDCAVTLIEKNSSCGRKLLLSGKGRCNLTNTCDLDSFLKRFSGNGQFLRDAFKKFFYQDLINFFKKRGLGLKVERQGRVFPVTDRADSVLEVLNKELSNNQVNVIYNTKVKDITIEDDRIKIICDTGKIIYTDRLILATGGASYSFTGSDGEGIRLAKKLGHRITPLRPGLVPLNAGPSYSRILEGLTLKNIRIKFIMSSTVKSVRNVRNKQIVSDIGEVLFTDFGISGPLVLSLSGKVVDWLTNGGSVYAEIDLKPGLTEEQVNKRLLREFVLNSEMFIKNILANLLPKSMIGVFIDTLQINPAKRGNQITASERRDIVRLLKGFRLDITGSRPIDEAMVTRGGVSLKDIDPRTMQSRLIKGLYFAGEMIDVDADTGGFNLQAAFSTGYLAGESAALSR